MGIALSLNYSNVTPHFDFGIWKVSKGIHKATNRPVSIWIIDYQLMKERERNKKNRRNYIQFLMEAIQNQQKINHINILKIIEVQSAKKKIGFSSEQIETNLTLTGNNKYSRDESIYITQQIALTMRYVHDSMHTAFMGICPENIFLNTHFTLKLGMFIHSSAIQTDLAKITDPFIPFAPSSIFHVPCNWAAPEVIKNDTITSRADSYMYGLTCVYLLSGKVPSKATSIQSIDVKGPLELCNSIPEEFQDLMKKCLSGDPASRPNFDSITNDDAFSSLVARIFQYIEIISQKSDKDLFNFFKGLKTAINVFSDRIIKQKFMPIFIYYIRKDPRYSYALSPIFFRCISKYSIQDYVEKVMRPIKSFLTQYDNPKVNSLLLDYVGMLTKRIPSEFHEEIVFPIVFAALKSSDINVVMSALQMMPPLMDLMKMSYIRSDTVPNLLKVAETSQVPDIVILVVNLISLAMKKTGPEYVAETAFPVFKNVWQRMKWPKLADALADVVQLCDVPVELLFSTTLQMALLIISNEKVSTTTHARMIFFVQNALQKIGRQYKLSAADFEAASKFAVNQPDLEVRKLKDILEEEEDEDELDESSQSAQLSFLGNLNAGVNQGQNQTRPQPSQPSQQQQQNQSIFGSQPPPAAASSSSSFQKQQQQMNQASFGSQPVFSNSSSSNFQQQQNDPFNRQQTNSSFQKQNEQFSNQSSSSNFQQQKQQQNVQQNPFSFNQQPTNNPFTNQSSFSSYHQQPTQQQQQQQQLTPQYSSSFDIFNQTPSNSSSLKQQQQQSNSFEIFRNQPPQQSQHQQNNNNSFQSFPHYPQQQQQQQQQQHQQINPYDNNPGFNPF